MDTERRTFERTFRQRASRLPSRIAAACLSGLTLVLSAACATTDPFADAAEELGESVEASVDSGASAIRYLEGWSALDAVEPPAVEPKGHYMSVLKEPGASRLEFLEPAYSLPGRAAPERYSVATRRVLVYLPAGYDADPDRRYPVLYFQDGQNVWDSSAANHGGSKADTVMDRMLAAGEVRPAIIVSIFNTGYRSQEYAGAGFDRATGDVRALAIAEYYRDWTVEVLKPEIDRRYRTLGDRANTGVVGSSYGGTLAAYWALSRPEVFGMGASVSYAPGDEKDFAGGLTALARETYLPALAASGLRPPRFWLDCGLAGLDATLAPFARAFDEVLRSGGFEPGPDYRFELFAGADHNEAAWYRRLPGILAFLLPPGGSAGE